jgi:hypothetical protein
MFPNNGAVRSVGRMDFAEARLDSLAESPAADHRAAIEAPATHRAIATHSITIAIGFFMSDVSNRYHRFTAQRYIKMQP